MTIFIIIALIIILIIVHKCRKKTLPMYSECIRLYTGAPGSGKSLNASKEAYEAYCLQAKHHRFYKKFPKFLRWIPKKIFRGSEYPPHLFSTIPIKLYSEGHGKKKVTVYSEPLQREHLLFLKKVPMRSVIFIDEAGAVFSQWEYDNPYVKEQVQFFFRFFRQMIDGTIIMTEQASSRLAKPVREVLGKYYYLDSFHKLLGFLPIARINVTPMIIAEDTATRINTEVNEWSIYVWLLGKKRYDSRAYSELYNKPVERSCDKFTSPKTNYLIDLTVSQNEQKAYKANRDIYHDWIYADRPFNDD